VLVTAPCDARWSKRDKESRMQVEEEQEEQVEEEQEEQGEEEQG
jgi:hypothetical protein